MELFLSLGALAGFVALYNTWMIQRQFKQLGKELQWMTDLKLRMQNSHMKDWSVMRAIVTIGQAQREDAKQNLANTN